jgi:hypothetical protein
MAALAQICFEPKTRSRMRQQTAALLAFQEIAQATSHSPKIDIEIKQ